MYVIYKITRTPGFVSYSGPSWDRAGIRDQYKETYSDKEEATRLAKKLYEVNPAGFAVVDVDCVKACSNAQPCDCVGSCKYINPHI